MKFELLSDISALIEREIADGTDKHEVALPIIASCDLRLCVPRIPNFKAMIAAKKKPIINVKLESIIHDKPDFKCIELKEYEFPAKAPMKITIEKLKKEISIKA